VAAQTRRTFAHSARQIGAGSPTVRRELIAGGGARADALKPVKGRPGAGDVSKGGGCNAGALIGPRKPSVAAIGGGLKRFLGLP
jgi:hypothetical protein